MKRKLVGLLGVLSLLVVLGGCTQVDPGFAVVQTSAGVEILVDDLSGAITAVDLAHQRIHEGEHYFAFRSVAIPNAADFEFLIVTPDTIVVAHMFLSSTVSAEATIDLLEGVTTAGDGAAVLDFNNNRQSVNTSGVVITHTPAGLAGGTDLLNGGIKVGAGRNIGGVSRNDNELLLERNTKYLLRITNDAAGANNITTVSFSWYEHIE